jgi:hypothetical protein
VSIATLPLEIGWAILPYCHGLDTYTVYKALRNGTQFFSLNEIHAHRVVEEHGYRPCNWGKHLDNLYDVDQCAILELEGA